MVAADLPAILDVQAQCYGNGFLESRDALASRLNLSPATCWVAEDPSRRGALAAYLLTHPWPQDSLPPLDAVLTRHWTDEADLLWFVHDMAVAPAGRGGGLAVRLYRAAHEAAMATGLRASRLIAVQSAAPWWRRLGYAPMGAEAASVHAEKLSAYGDGAVIMACTLTGHRQQAGNGKSEP